MTIDQWLQEAQNHLDANHYQQALEAYEQVIKLDPRRTYAYARKGQVLSALNRYQEALEAYGQALQLAPNTAFLHILRGDVLYDCGRYVEALAAIELALQLDSNVTTGHGSKGQVLEALKRYPEALAAYEQAIRINPDYESYRRGRERVLRLLGKTERWWVMRREANDAGPGGYYRRQQKYSGPFATKSEAWTKAQELNDTQRRSISDEHLDKTTRRALFEARVNYWPMSEDEIEEARRNGTSIY
jgi:tetratricopeptide (TPR) repeat protein